MIFGGNNFGILLFVDLIMCVIKFDRFDSVVIKNDSILLHLLLCAVVVVVAGAGFVAIVVFWLL